jgi:outer membrane protein OmpA-like peptidoglycan-associated protein
MDQVDMRWRSYQSAEPTIALARARQRLSPPEGVVLDLAPDGRLVASGVAEPAWMDRAALLAPTVPGVATIDTQNLRTSDAALEAIARERLAPLQGISVRAISGTLQLNGRASAAWIRSVPQRLGDIAWLKHLDLSGLETLEHLELARLRTSIEGTRILFPRGSADLSEHSQGQLTRLAAQTRRAAQLATTLGLQPRLQLIGRTDGIGDPKQNARLALQRTRRSAEFLLNLGIEAAELDEQPTPTRSRGGRSTPELRRVEFRLDLLSNGKDE